MFVTSKMTNTYKRYPNTGEYDELIVNGIAESYCKWRGIDLTDDIVSSGDFLDFVLYILEQWAYGKTVKRFVSVYKKRRLEDGFHDPNAADYMLDTFTKIYKLKYKRWEERQETINHEIINKFRSEQ